MEVIIIILVIGLIIGAVAKFLVPGPDPGGIFGTSLIGIAGAFIAAYGGHALGIYRTGETVSFIGAVVGAVVLLLILRLSRR
jgi:uncharacterized membrane protein YeaQ/YmgE (transglycosylase-associated protein family)